ncbi:MAG: hypothetical protein LCH85_20155 [Chloroflexi bacterium]|nr:hypothetical protein [Chloroflexota bacterium]
MSIEKVMEYLFTRIPNSLPPELFAGLLEQLAWLMDDNGKDIYQVIDGWLNSDDKEKVKIALAITDVLLLESDEAYHTTVARIVERWPELEPMCIKFQQLWEQNKK